MNVMLAIALLTGNMAYLYALVAISSWVWNVQRLLLKAMHKYDNYLLRLTYITEDHCEAQYYCLICEQERDLNHWFHYCADYNFFAHLHCILKKYPYVKFGNAFIPSYLGPHNYDYGIIITKFLIYVVWASLSHVFTC